MGRAAGSFTSLGSARLVVAAAVSVASAQRTSTEGLRGTPCRRHAENKTGTGASKQRGRDQQGVSSGRRTANDLDKQTF